MAIRVRHENLADSGQVGLSIGQMQGAAQAAAQEEARQRFLLSLAERQAARDDQIALNLYGQRRADDRFYAGLGAQAASQQDAINARLVDAERARQAQLLGNQLDGQQALQREQLRYAGQAANDARDQQFSLLRDSLGDQFAWQQDAARSMDDYANDLLKAANKMKLTQEGQRLKNEWVGKVNRVRSQRGTLRPDAYAQVMQQAVEQFGNLGLDAHEEVTPTIEQRFQQETYTDADGTVYGIDRSNNIRKLKDPPKQKTPGVIDPDDFSGEYNRAYQRLLQSQSLLGPDDPRRQHTISQQDVIREMQQFASAQSAFYGPQAGAQAAAQPSHPMGLGGFTPAPASPPVPVRSRGEADALEVGQSFVVNGQLYIKTGPGQAEPVEMQ